MTSPIEVTKIYTSVRSLFYIFIPYLFWHGPPNISRSWFSYIIIMVYLQERWCFSWFSYISFDQKWSFLILSDKNLGGRQAPFNRPVRWPPGGSVGGGYIKELYAQHTNHTMNNSNIYVYQLRFIQVNLWHRIYLVDRTRINNKRYDKWGLMDYKWIDKWLESHVCWLYTVTIVTLVDSTYLRSQPATAIMSVEKHSHRTTLRRFVNSIQPTKHISHCLYDPP